MLDRSPVVPAVGMVVEPGVVVAVVVVDVVVVGVAVVVGVGAAVVEADDGAKAVASRWTPLQVQQMTVGGEVQRE